MCVSHEVEFFFCVSGVTIRGNFFLFPLCDSHTFGGYFPKNSRHCYSSIFFHFVTGCAVSHHFCIGSGERRASAERRSRQRERRAAAAAAAASERRSGRRRPRRRQRQQQVQEEAEEGLLPLLGRIEREQRGRRIGGGRRRRRGARANQDADHGRSQGPRPQRRPKPPGN